PAPRAARGRAGQPRRPDPSVRGHDHPRGLREQRRGLRALPGRMAGRQRLRPDPRDDGGRGHRRDRPRPAVAMAAPLRSARPPRRRQPGAPGRRHGGRLRPVRTHPGRAARAPGRHRRPARRQPHRRGDRAAGRADPRLPAGRVPDPAGLRPPRLTAVPAPAGTHPHKPGTRRDPASFPDARKGTGSGAFAPDPRKNHRTDRHSPRRTTMSTLKTAEQIQPEWNADPSGAGSTRNYTAEDVVRLRGTIPVDHSIARITSGKLWNYLQDLDFVNALGALTGNQAMQQVKAGLKAIYLSGWQVAADANLAGQMYPDQSLYPADSVPAVVKRINNTLLRADQLHHAEGNDSIDFLQPIVADAEAGFGGVLNAFELMKAMIEAGAAGVHFEDQLASVKKCGHMGGKVLVPTREAVEKLNPARLAADVMGVPTILIARTDAAAANLLASDIDENDRPFCSGERTVEGFFRTHNGLDQAIARGLAYAPYADLIWCETGKPDLEFARKFAEAIHAGFR